MVSSHPYRPFPGVWGLGLPIADSEQLPNAEPRIFLLSRIWGLAAVPRRALQRLISAFSENIMDADESLHVIPAPLGKKRIPVRATGRHPGLWLVSHGRVANIDAFPVLEGLQCMSAV
jgi:hypothetical protein